jgi:hypothetical protein
MICLDFIATVVALIWLAMPARVPLCSCEHCAKMRRVGRSDCCCEHHKWKRAQGYC